MNINSFRSDLRFGGARTSLFDVQITNPIDGSADSSVPLRCKAASLPGYTINPLEAFHFGRPIKLPGNRTFEDWNVTFYNDEDYAIRDQLEAWVNSVNSPEANRRELTTSAQSLYKSDALVTQLSQTGQRLRSYKFSGLFPTQVAPIEMDWANEAIQEYQVTFSIDYFYVDTSITGDAGGV